MKSDIALVSGCCCSRQASAINHHKTNSNSGNNTIIATSAATATNNQKITLSTDNIATDTASAAQHSSGRRTSSSDAQQVCSGAGSARPTCAADKIISDYHERGRVEPINDQQSNNDCYELEKIRTTNRTKSKPNIKSHTDSNREDNVTAIDSNDSLSDNIDLICTDAQESVRIKKQGNNESVLVTLGRCHCCAGAKSHRLVAMAKLAHQSRVSYNNHQQQQALPMSIRRLPSNVSLQSDEFKQNAFSANYLTNTMDANSKVMHNPFIGTKIKSKTTAKTSKQSVSKHTATTKKIGSPANSLVSTTSKVSSTISSSSSLSTSTSNSLAAVAIAHQLHNSRQMPMDLNEEQTISNDRSRRRRSSSSSSSSYRVDMSDFDLLKVLGTGAYGKVFLVRKLNGHDKGKLYAMKVLNKEIVAQKTKTLDHTRTERKVLEAIRNEPFLVTMHYAFQTKTKLHLILDYVNGGELFTHLYQRDHFKEDDVRIYIGELVLALDKLHKVSYTLVFI